jgi:hypothetical protein
MNFTDTMRDVKAAVQAERDAARRESLLASLDMIDREHTKMREELVALRIQNASIVTVEKAKIIADEATRVLTERVEWHTWLLRVVIVATVIELVAGVMVGFVVHGIK